MLNLNTLKLRRHRKVSAKTKRLNNLHRFRDEWEKAGGTRGTLRKARKALRATGVLPALFPTLPLNYKDPSEVEED